MAEDGGNSNRFSAFWVLFVRPWDGRGEGRRRRPEASEGAEFGSGRFLIDFLAIQSGHDIDDGVEVLLV